MTVAVTGGGGFIGRRLVKRLLGRGQTVRVLSRRPDPNVSPRVANWMSDLAKPNSNLVDFVDGADVLLHCAAEIRDEAAMVNVNVHGTERLISAARGHIKHWVQLSSVGVYGPHRVGTVTELSESRPVGLYETTKAQSDRLVMEATERGWFSATILRPSIVYGPDMSNQSLFSMISLIDRGLFVFAGPPGASANYIHVDNVVHALVLCALQMKGPLNVYNLSGYQTIEQVVATIAQTLGRPMPRVRIPVSVLRIAAQGLPMLWRGCPLTESRVEALSNRSSYPIDRIRAALGYEHVISMDDGFRALAQTWRLRRV